VILRPYQTKLLDDIRAAIRQGHRRILAVLPTGGGKTVVSSAIAQGATSRNKRVWFNVHRDFLLAQTLQTYERMGLECSTICAGARVLQDTPVSVNSVPTLARRFERIPLRADIHIWDEAHHVVAGQWDKLFQAYPDAIHIGLTATPERLDGKGLGTHFDVMVMGPTVSELMELGALSRYRAFAPPTAGFSRDGLHTRAGEFVASEVEEMLDKPHILGDLVQHYRERAMGLKAVYFAASIQHSKHIAEAFNNAGIPALHLDAEASSEERAAGARALARGDVSVLTNCALFGEGYDLSAQAGMDVTIDCVGLARPTQSLTLYLQQVGRALRPAHGKTAIILDHVGNIATHGFPDEDRAWHLDGRPRKKATEVKTKTCPACFAENVAQAVKCVECGHQLSERSERTDLEQRDGELVELTPEMIAAERERKRLRHMEALRRARDAQSMREMQDVAREFGYKPGWAWHQWQLRGRGGSAGSPEAARQQAG